MGDPVLCEAVRNGTAAVKVVFKVVGINEIIVFPPSAAATLPPPVTVSVQPSMISDTEVLMVTRPFLVTLALSLKVSDGSLGSLPPIVPPPPEPLLGVDVGMGVGVTPAVGVSVGEPG